MQEASGGPRSGAADVVSDVELFDRPTAWRFHAVERLGLSGEDRVAGLAMGAGYPAALAPIREVVSDLDGYVCDVGSGLGAAATWVGGSGAARMVAIEPEIRAAALARRAFPDLEVVSGSAMAIPLRDGRCAAATLLGLVSLVEDLSAVLAEVSRVVRVGGWVGLTDLVTASGTTTIPSAGNHLRSIEELAAAFGEHGIELHRAVEVSSVADGGWAAVASAVNEEVGRRHAGTPAYEAWRSDGEVLGRMMADGELRVMTLVARRTR